MLHAIDPSLKIPVGIDSGVHRDAQLEAVPPTRLRNKSTVHVRLRFRITVDPWTDDVRDDAVPPVVPPDVQRLAAAPGGGDAGTLGGDRRERKRCRPLLVPTKVERPVNSREA